jgi:hypothetical protein
MNQRGVRVDLHGCGQRLSRPVDTFVDRRSRVTEEPCVVEPITHDSEGAQRLAMFDRLSRMCQAKARQP